MDETLEVLFIDVLSRNEKLKAELEKALAIAKQYAKRIQDSIKVADVTIDLKFNNLDGVQRQFEQTFSRLKTLADTEGVALADVFEAFSQGARRATTAVDPLSNEIRDLSAQVSTASNNLRTFGGEDFRNSLVRLQGTLREVGDSNALTDQQLKQVTASYNLAERAVRGFDTAQEGLRVKPVADEIQNLGTQLRVAASNLAGGLGGEAVTRDMDALLRRTNALRDGTQLTNRQIRELTTSYNVGANALRRYRTEQERTTASTRGLSTSMGGLQSSLFALTGGLGFRELSRRLVQFTQSTFDAEIALKIFNRELDVTGQSRLIGGDVLNRLATEFKATNDQVAQGAVQLLRYGATVEQTEEILRRGAASALAFGRSTEAGFEAVAQAIVGEQSQILNRIGIAGNLSTVYKEYADDLGTVTDQLTQQQKIQAAITLLMRETGGEVEAVSVIMSGFGGAMQDLRRESLLASRALGESVKPALTDIATFGASTLRVFQQIPEPLRAAGVAAAAAAVGVTALAGAFAVLRIAAGALFGPVGLIVTGVTVVAGLAAGLASLRSQEAGASAETRRLAGALEEAQLATVNVKTAFDQSVSSTNTFVQGLEALQDAAGRNDREGMRGIALQLAGTMREDVAGSFLAVANTAIDSSDTAVQAFETMLTAAREAQIQAKQIQLDALQGQQAGVNLQRSVFGAPGSATQIRSELQDGIQAANSEIEKLENNIRGRLDAISDFEGIELDISIDGNLNLTALEQSLTDAGVDSEPVLASIREASSALQEQAQISEELRQKLTENAEAYVSEGKQIEALTARHNLYGDQILATASSLEALRDGSDGTLQPFRDMLAALREGQGASGGLPLGIDGGGAGASAQKVETLSSALRTLQEDLSDLQRFSGTPLLEAFGIDDIDEAAINILASGLEDIANTFDVDLTAPDLTGLVDPSQVEAITQQLSGLVDTLLELDGASAVELQRIDTERLVSRLGIQVELDPSTVQEALTQLREERTSIEKLITVALTTEGFSDEALQALQGLLGNINSLTADFEGQLQDSVTGITQSFTTTLVAEVLAGTTDTVSALDELKAEFASLDGQLGTLSLQGISEGVEVETIEEQMAALEEAIQAVSDRSLELTRTWTTRVVSEFIGGTKDSEEALGLFEPALQKVEDKIETLNLTGISEGIEVETLEAQAENLRNAIAAVGDESIRLTRTWTTEVVENFVQGSEDIFASLQNISPELITLNREAGTLDLSATVEGFDIASLEADAAQLQDALQSIETSAFDLSRTWSVNVVDSFVEGSQQSEDAISSLVPELQSIQQNLDGFTISAGINFEGFDTQLSGSVLPQVDALQGELDTLQVGTVFTGLDAEILQARGDVSSLQSQLEDLKVTGVFDAVGTEAIDALLPQLEDIQTDLGQINISANFQNEDEILAQLETLRVSLGDVRLEAIELEQAFELSTSAAFIQNSQSIYDSLNSLLQPALEELQPALEDVDFQLGTLRASGVFEGAEFDRLTGESEALRDAIAAINSEALRLVQTWTVQVNQQFESGLISGREALGALTPALEETRAQVQTLRIAGVDTDELDAAEARLRALEATYNDVQDALNRQLELKIDVQQAEADLGNLTDALTQQQLDIVANLTPNDLPITQRIKQLEDEGVLIGVGFIVEAEERRKLFAEAANVSERAGGEFTIPFRFTPDVGTPDIDVQSLEQLGEDAARIALDTIQAQLDASDFSANLPSLGFTSDNVIENLQIDSARLNVSTSLEESAASAALLGQAFDPLQSQIDTYTDAVESSIEKNGQSSVITQALSDDLLALQEQYRQTVTEIELFNEAAARSAQANTSTTLPFQVQADFDLTFNEDLVDQSKIAQAIASVQENVQEALDAVRLIFNPDVEVETERFSEQLSGFIENIQPDVSLFQLRLEFANDFTKAKQEADLLGASFNSLGARTQLLEAFTKRAADEFGAGSAQAQFFAAALAEAQVEVSKLGLALDPQAAQLQAYADKIGVTVERLKELVAIGVINIDIAIDGGQLEKELEKIGKVQGVVGGIESGLGLSTLQEDIDLLRDFGETAGFTKGEIETLVAQAKLLSISTNLAKYAADFDGVAKAVLEAGSDISKGIAQIMEEGAELEGLATIIRGVTDAIQGISEAANDDAGFDGNDLFDLYAGASVAVAEVAGTIAGIPGLGQLAAASMELLGAVIGDLGNGIKEVEAQVKELAKNFDLLSEDTVSSLKVTVEVPRGGFAGAFDPTKTALDKEATDAALKLANDFASAFTSGIQSGDITESLQNVINQELIKAFVLLPAVQGQIGALTEEVQEALADGIISDDELAELQIKIDKLEKAGKRLEPIFEDIRLETDIADLLRSAFDTGDVTNITQGFNDILKQELIDAFLISPEIVKARDDFKRFLKLAFEDGELTQDEIDFGRLFVDYFEGVSQELIDQYEDLFGGIDLGASIKDLLASALDTGDATEITRGFSNLLKQELIDAFLVSPEMQAARDELKDFLATALEDGELSQEELDLARLILGDLEGLSQEFIDQYQDLIGGIEDATRNIEIGDGISSTLESALTSGNLAGITASLTESLRDAYVSAFIASPELQGQISSTADFIVDSLSDLDISQSELEDIRGFFDDLRDSVVDFADELALIEAELDAAFRVVRLGDGLTDSLEQALLDFDPSSISLGIDRLLQQELIKGFLLSPAIRAQISALTAFLDEAVATGSYDQEVLDKLKDAFRESAENFSDILRELFPELAGESTGNSAGVQVQNLTQESRDFFGEAFSPLGALNPILDVLYDIRDILGGETFVREAAQPADISAALDTEVFQVLVSSVDILNATTSSSGTEILTALNTNSSIIEANSANNIAGLQNIRESIEVASAHNIAGLDQIGELLNAIDRGRVTDAAANITVPVEPFTIEAASVSGAQFDEDAFDDALVPVVTLLQQLLNKDSDGGITIEGDIILETNATNGDELFEGFVERLALEREARG